MSSLTAALETPLRRAAALSARWSARRVAVVAVGVVTIARLVAAFAIHGPTLFPDEYFYTAISRGIAGGGLPTVRGGPFDFVSILGPLLTAPAWLVHDVGTAYRLAQAEGVVSMSLAALPAFALARRVGLTERSAAGAAIFAVIVPDAGFSSFLMSEPFAYPLFLLTIVLAVDALASPSARREALFVLSWILLCLTRVQFFFLEPAYLLAAVAVMQPPRLAAFIRTRRVTLVTPALLAAGVLVVGPGALVGQYSPLASASRTVGSLAHWTGLNVIVLFVAAGWLTIPGAAVGLARQLRSGNPAERAFSALTVLVILGTTGEAGVFGAGIDQLEERYTFYAAPLLVIGFLAALESGLIRGRGHGRVALALAGLTVLLPLDNRLFDANPDESPLLMGFGLLRRSTGWEAPIFVGAALLLLSVTALVLSRPGRAAAILPLAGILCALTSVGFAASVIPRTAGAAQDRWQLDFGPGHASYFASALNSHPADVMTTLFWNPRIDRVLALGGPRADNYNATRVTIAEGGRIVSAHGAISGPIVVDPALHVFRAGSGSTTTSNTFQVLRDGARLRIAMLVDGVARRPLGLTPKGEIVVAAGTPRGRVATTIRLRVGPAPLSKNVAMGFHCTNGLRRLVQVKRPTTVLLGLSGRGIAGCSFTMVSGELRVSGNRPVAVRLLSLTAS